MNKKRLSVVMAGAMLASSVAPVLAEEVQNNNVELTAAKKGELANSLTNKIWAAERFTAKDDALKGLSIYGIQINDKEAISFANSNKSTGSVSALQNDVKAALKDLRVGDVVKLVDLGHETVKEDGKDVIISTTSSTKYTEAELKYGIDKELLELEGIMTTNYSKLIDETTKLPAPNDSVSVTGYRNGVYTILVKADINKDGKKDANDTIELTTKSDRLNFKQYVTTDGQTINVDDTDFSSKFVGFAKAAPKLDDIEETVVESFTITSGGDTFKIGDLYDAPFLTTKGQELLDAAKEAASLESTSNKAKGFAVRFVDEVATPAGTLASDEISDLSTLKADKNGNYKVAVYIGNAARISERLSGGKWDETKLNDYDVYYITGTSRAEIATALGWIDAASAKVDVLAGEDRYATAVKIAKEVNLVGGKDVTKHIVLVNGGSLVDGLAASPLAKYLGDKDSTNAPILLTKANELPRATKRYLKELIDQETNKEVTVHIVGGEAVVSDSVKKELRELGLRVERLGGENREATSMAVAEAITDGVVENAFVVGANGEADAMSIAGYAASQKSPIIVSSYKGLSEDTIDALDGAKVNVIGGEAVVSNSDYEEIEAVAEKVDRVFGSNRKATNAEVINKFYKGDFASKPQSVIVAKDDELIDALTSANLSVEHNAPIVLGTKSLSKDQINAIVTNAKTAKKVYQVGGNVAKEVVKTVAEALNLI